MQFLNRSFDGFVFLDGASGTMLQKTGLLPGQRPDILNIIAPNSVESVARAYLEAGSDIIYTNTFGANAHALRKSGFTPADIISAAVSITKNVCRDRALTALDIGPLGDFIEPLGSLSFTAAYDLFKEQAVAGALAGADLVVIETMSDLLELKAAICAARENTDLPVFATMTFDKSGRTFAGCLPECFAVTATRLGASAIGLNCSLEPVQMLPIAKRIASMTHLPLIIKPNAGLPDSDTGLYGLNASDFALQMSDYANIGARFIGGCCGTTPDYIRHLRRVFKPLTPTKPDAQPGTFICSASRFAPIDNFLPRRPASSGFLGFEAELDYISAQADTDSNIVETAIPDDPALSASLIAAAREITDKPLCITSGNCLNALISALREVCGIAAVSSSDSLPQLTMTAQNLGAVLI